MHGLLCLQAAAKTILLDPEQHSALRALHKTYTRQVAEAHAECQDHLRSLQASQASLVPELSQPHLAAALLACMSCISSTFALQQEAYLNLIRSFVLHILTPFQAGLLCAAAYPYLIEFPSVLWHMLSAPGAPIDGDGDALHQP